ncbi:MAG: HemK2/MTQ2 family protein methyltransferase [Sciscionella sp.]
MTLLRPPGVYPVQDDTSLLIDVMRCGDHARGRSVLDVGTGTGALAIAAARAGAATVTAIDLSVRSVLASWLNSRFLGVPVTVQRGDLFEPLAGRRVDLVLTNPPYVPANGGLLPRHRMARCWDAGLDGRVLLDRICDGVSAVLNEDGALLLVQSELSGEEATLARLEKAGLFATVAGRARIPFGPVLRAREPMLRACELLRPDQFDEELIVIEARRRG